MYEYSDGKDDKYNDVHVNGEDDCGDVNAAEDDDEWSSKSVALSDLTLIWYAELADLAWITSLRLLFLTIVMIMVMIVIMVMKYTKLSKKQIEKFLWSGSCDICGPTHTTTTHLQQILL